MSYHLFCRLAPWSLQDCPKAPKLSPRPPPYVPRRPNWWLACPQNLPQTSPGVPKCIQATPRPLPDVHRRFPRAPPRSRSIRKIRTFPPTPTHLHPKTMVSSPKSKVPGQKSRVHDRVGGPLKGLQFLNEFRLAISATLRMQLKTQT